MQTRAENSGIRNPAETEIIAMITDEEVSELEEDQRRGKNRPDRRRRQTIRLIQRLRDADAILGRFREILARSKEISGDPSMRVGSLWADFHRLGLLSDQYKRKAEFRDE